MIFLPEYNLYCNLVKLFFINAILNSLDGRVARASASGAAGTGLIWVKPMTLKLVFTASLLKLSRESVENKPASSIVELIKALCGIPILE